MKSKAKGKIRYDIELGMRMSWVLWGVYDLTRIYQQGFEIF